MKKNPLLVKAVLAVLAAAPLAGVALADETQPSAQSGQLITGSAKVEKVDKAKRELVLKGQDGREFTVDVPQSVTRLDNVKPGDTVHLSFYESVAVTLAKPGEAPVGESTQTFKERSAGKLPSGMTGQQVTTTAKITKIDLAKNEIAIEGPQGKKNTIQVRDPQNQAALKKLKVGDEIQTTYTEALATRVTPTQQMPG
jgi:hypothetical protein